MTEKNRFTSGEPVPMQDVRQVLAAIDTAVDELGVAMDERDWFGAASARAGLDRARRKIRSGGWQ